MGMVSPLLTILANTSGLGAGNLSANGNTVAVALCGLATEDAIEGALLAACGFDLFAWAGASLVKRHAL
jgi:hypothetical protein